MDASAYDWMPLAAEVLFFAFFSLVLWYVVSDRRRRHLDRMAHAALDDGMPCTDGETREQARG